MDLPEARVNIFCVGSDAGAASWPYPEPLDWEKILEYAQIHGVLQFLAAAVDRFAIQPPPPWNAILTTQRQRNTVRAMLQHRECGAILRALAEADVPAVTFKGTSLSKLLYGRVADRISSDVDLLIRPADLQRARGVIEKLGYAPADAASRMETEELLACGIEAAFVNPGGVVVEVHWRVLESGQACGLPNDFESLAVVGDHLSNEDLFLILVLHGLAHRWELLKWAVDIDAFVRNVAVDWDSLWTRAAMTGALRATHIALQLVHDLLETQIPKPIADKTARRLARRYVRTLLTGDRIRPTSDFWMQLAARERWIDRWRFIRFVARVKPWDRAGRGPRTLSRFFRLLTQNFRHSHLAEVQKIPELQARRSDRRAV